MTRTEIPAQTGECSPDGAKTASAIPGGKEADLISDRDKRQRISRYKAPEGGGVIGLISMIGISIVLMGCRLHFVRQFLGLAIIAGGAVALVLYWGRRRRQDSSIASYKSPAGGQVAAFIVVLVFLFIGLVGSGHPMIRYFLELAVTAGGVVALALYWGRRRQNSSISFV